MKLSRCKTCDKKVYFVEDEKGKTQILDAVAPVYTAKTNFAMGTETDRIIELVEKVHRTKLSFVSHFATCRDASLHSKAKK